MKILDRYIIRLFVINFLILLFVLFTLLTLIDVVINLDEFLEAGRYFASQHGGVIVATLWAILDYNGPLSVLLYVFLAGVLATGAMGFTFTALARSGELTAMATSGISMYRLAGPIIVVGGLLIALTVPIQELIVPQLALKLQRKHSQISESGAHKFAVPFAADSAGRLFSAQKFVPGKQLLRNVIILERAATDEAGLEAAVTRRITADRAVWDPQMKGWQLENGRSVRPKAAGMALVAAMQRVTFIPTDLSPQVLLVNRATIYPRLLSIRRLRQLSGKPGVDDAKFSQIMHSRFSMLIVNVLILVMALAFFLLREPTNMLLQAVKAAGLCLGTWGGAMVIVQLGATQLPPATAAWLPVVFYLPLAAVMLMTIKT